MRLTLELYNFWKKNGMLPLYLKMLENDITGEHSCIMIKSLSTNLSNNNAYLDNGNWANNFSDDFKRRFISYLAFDFRNLPIRLALSLLDPQLTNTTSEDTDNGDILDIENNLNQIITKEQLSFLINDYDFKRLEMYVNNRIRYGLILDLLPDLAKFFFLKKFKGKSILYSSLNFTWEWDYNLNLLNI